MANHDYDKNHPERSGRRGDSEEKFEFYEQERPQNRSAREPEYEEYEEYERHLRRGGERETERLRREREAEQPDYEPADELDFSMEDVPRGHRRRRRRHRDAGHGCLVGAMYTAFVLGVSMFLAAFIIIAANEVFAFVKPDRTAVIELDADVTAAEVADLLKDAGIIEYPSLFKLYCSVSGATFKSGKYEINANLDYSAIARTLRRTSTYKETVRVTIPEGYTTAQIVDALVEKGVASSEDLYNAIENYDFDYAFIDGIGDSKTRLEGYLFPDTYEFYVNDSAPNVIAKFLTNFNNKFTQKLRDRAEELGLTINEVVTIASMVEREARRDDERAVVASVIYNRLADPGTFPRLQIDATVQYIVGRAPTADDLKIDDPYNTYLYNGLPPGPIANPGIASLEAALYPADTSYYYYVARSDGSHIFSKTLDEHNAAIAEVNAASDTDEEENGEG